MNVLSQLMTTSVLLLILATIGFVGLPSDACQRTQRFTTIAYVALGSVPWIGEKLSQQEWPRLWADAEDISAATHTFVNRYFGVTQCPAPQWSFYGRQADDGNGAEWLKQNDPELYELLVEGQK